jgi:hypothetical protein
VVGGAAVVVVVVGGAVVGGAAVVVVVSGGSVVVVSSGGRVVVVVSGGTVVVVGGTVQRTDPGAVEHDATWIFLAFPRYRHTNGSRTTVPSGNVITRVTVTVQPSDPRDTTFSTPGLRLGFSS